MKWIWFSILGAIFYGLARTALNHGWNEVSAVLGLVMVIFVVASIAEFITHYGEVSSYIYERRQNAFNQTPLVRISESLKYLHPENSKLLGKFIAQTVWDVDIDIKTGEREWMLCGYDVHFGFIEFVLDNSKNGKLYPRNKFVEGSKVWDPRGVTDDREQHRQFEEWLATRLIVVREYGDNHPALFMPPWTPERLKEVMGFGGPVDLYKPEEVAMVEDLKKLDEAKAQSQTAPSPAVPAKVKEEGLTDDEAQRIRTLEDAKATMSPREYLKFCQSLGNS